MKKALDDAALDILFREARSYNRWAPEAVPEKTLHALYELLKWGPTSANCCPARFVFVTSAASKAMLAGCVSPGNVAKVEQAPVTVIIGMDEKFYEKIPFLFPHRPQAGEGLKDPAVGRVVMMRNSSLQGAYLILAARSLGLDCGPMSGFDNAKVDTAFFGGTSVKSNFICALGVGTTELLYARSPRLPFDEACKII
ncbi:MAG TPA: malonic semialdehyde reductase [Steroidobacteraceae bacterium]|jgi:3-hydroxypropanoate dehydrogenase|nr:malonic semialdehyde reductase [Steroidobacteraceae bacterium]